MKTRILLSVFLCCLSIVAWGQSCSYCNGTGKMIINKGGGTYGYGNDDLVWCSDCQEYFRRSTGHAHIHCKYCKGTGRRSSSSSYDSDSYNPESPEAALGWNIASTMRYGVPVTEEESAYYAEFQRIDPAGAAQYKKLRDLINSTVIYHNRQLALQNWQTVKSLDAYQNQMMQQIGQLAETFTPSQGLINIVNKYLLAKLGGAYGNYRRYCESQESIQNSKDRLFYEELMRLNSW